jgi:hypothetical protein
MVRPLSLLLLYLLGQSAIAYPSDELALGLNKLRWNMSPREVRGQYAFVSDMSRHPGLYPPTSLRELYIDDYAYAGCEFSGVLRFARDELFSVELTKTAPSNGFPCRARIESEFSRRYGVKIAYYPADKPQNGSWHPFSGSYGEYKGPFTTARYELNPAMEISFRDSVGPTPGGVIYNVQLQHLPKGQK